MLRASFLTGITRLTVECGIVDGRGRERESRESECSAGRAGCSADTPYANSVSFDDETVVMFGCQSVGEVLQADTEGGPRL